MKKKIVLAIMLMVFLVGCKNNVVEKELTVKSNDNISDKDIKDVSETKNDLVKINNNKVNDKKEELNWVNKNEIFKEKTFKLDTDEKYKLTYFDEFYSFDSKTFTRTKYKIPYLETVLALYENSMFYAGTDENYYLADFKSEKSYKLNDIDKKFNGYTECFRIENNILYFSDREFLYKLNMKTRELEKIDFKPYKDVVNSLIKEEFVGTIYADSAGIYFLTDSITVQNFIGLSWDKKVMFIFDQQSAPTITKDHIYFYHIRDNSMYKYDRTGKLKSKYSPDNLVKDLEWNMDWKYRASNNRIYYEIYEDGIYSIQDNSNYRKIVDIDRDFARNKAGYYDENITLIDKEKIGIFNIGEQKYTLEIRLENDIDECTDYYYGDKSLNYLAWFPQIRYKNIERFSNEDVIFISIVKEDNKYLWAISIATKEKYLIDTVKYTANPKYLDRHNRAWEKEVFTKDGTIYYFNNF